MKKGLIAQGMNSVRWNINLWTLCFPISTAELLSTDLLMWTPTTIWFLLGNHRAQLDNKGKGCSKSDFWHALLGSATRSHRVWFYNLNMKKKKELKKKKKLPSVYITGLAWVQLCKHECPNGISKAPAKYFITAGCENTCWALLFFFYLGGTFPSAWQQLNSGEGLQCAVDGVGGVELPYDATTTTTTIPARNRYLVKIKKGLNTFNANVMMEQ